MSRSLVSRGLLSIASLVASSAAVSVALLTTAVPAAAQSLPFDEARKLAVQRSQQLPAADHAGRAAREMAHAAARLPDPVLTLGIDNVPVEGMDRFSTTRDGMTMRRIGVMQEFTRGDKRAARSGRYLAESDKAAAEKRMAAAAIERETADAWFEVHHLQLMHTLANEQLAQMRIELQGAEAAVRGGRGSTADVFAARGAVIEAEDRAAGFAQRIRAARARLVRWVGPAGEWPLEKAPNIHELNLDLSALDAQLAHHPEIAVLARNEDIAQANARLALAERRPDWSLEVMFGQRPGYDNMVSFAVSLPLPWDRANRQDREHAARLAELEQARAEREEALRAHIGEVRTMVVDWQDLRARAARLRGELLPLTKSRHEAALAAYRGGRGMLDDVLRARGAELEARMQILELEMEAARTWARLNHMVPQAHVEGVSQ